MRMVPGLALNALTVTCAGIALGCLFAGRACGADLPGAPPGAVLARGFTWQQARYPSAMTGPERRDALLQGLAQQALGIVVAPGLALEGFLQLGYKVDSERLDYNNKLTPDIGVRLRWLPLSWLSVESGARFGYEYRWVTDRVAFGPAGYVGWSLYDEIELFGDESVRAPRRLVRSGWGELRYPSAKEGEERQDLLLEGAFRLDLDWFEFGRELRIALRSELEYSVDSKQIEYNNKLIPSVGVVAKISDIGIGRFEVSARYELDYRWTISSARSGLSVFAGWSTSWDALAHRAVAKK